MSASVYVNGKEYDLSNTEPSTTLLEFLRSVRLVGTKLGCGEGGCGACSVMLQTFDHETSTVLNRSCNACLTPVWAVEGCAIITIEGLGSIAKGMHPLQKAIADAHGSQCGFCTPGIVMSIAATLRNNPNATMMDLESALDGNICRCTGYRPILEAYKPFASDYAGSCCSSSGGSSGGCCGGKGASEGGCCGGKEKEQQSASSSSGCSGCSSDGGCCKKDDSSTEESSSTSTQSEPIFPTALRTRVRGSLAITSKSPSTQTTTWYRPASLDELLALRAEHGDALRIVMGNTEMGIETKIKGSHVVAFAHPVLIPELQELSHADSTLTIGSATTLSTLKSYLETELREDSVAAAIADQLRWFAGNQVRNMASIGGNIITASPISDLIPLLVAAGATFRLIDTDGKVEDVASGEFFLSYRKTALKANQLLHSVLVPLAGPNDHFANFKQAKRKEDDIAIVSAGMRVTVCDGVVTAATLAYGGMAATVMTAKSAGEAMVGQPWTIETVRAAIELLDTDMPLADNAPGGMVPYRRRLAAAFLYKFFLRTQEHPDMEEHEPTPTKSAQIYMVSEEGFSEVRKPVVHAAAYKQATGEALYADDYPLTDGELHAFPLQSTRPRARIVSVDASEALAIPGVVDFVDHTDIPGHNTSGEVVQDEEVFASERVTHVGQWIGLVIAESHALARRAARAVVVEYDEDEEPVLSIDQAIAADSYIPNSERRILKGDVEEALAKAPRTLSGSTRVGGQEQFYMETNVVLATPGEDGEMDILATTQSLAGTQLEVSHVLGVPANKVKVTAKRLGGGFGGKETRNSPLACAVAVAAVKNATKVRLVLDRDTDMTTTGGRHPFLGNYTVGYDDEGVLQALDMQLYNDAGHSMDLSVAVLERAISHTENAYHIPAARIAGRCCLTNRPSNTAFRGFGAPQGLMIMESVMDRIARDLGIDVALVRERNLSKEGQSTTYGQELTQYRVPLMFERLKPTYEALKEDAEAFNTKHTWRKRGVSLLPVSYGMCFGQKFLNQAGALVLIYRDGSVLVNHGGVEIGQGLHTKMCQVAADALGVDLSVVHIMETATDKVPNASATAASMSSDLNGMAILDACKQLRERLEPYLEAQNGDWKAAVHTAYFDRVSLAASGYWKLPIVPFNWNTNEGELYAYWTTGVAASLVEVDVLTGAHEALSTSILMDVGKPLNPAIDVGQIEGAFAQGMGLFTTEEIVMGDREANAWVRDGWMHTQGPGTYKVPGASSMPREMNVELLEDSDNPFAIHSSRGIGEPPLFLGGSVALAAKDAVYRAREALLGDTSFADLQFPATCERLRMAVGDVEFA